MATDWSKGPSTGSSRFARSRRHHRDRPRDGGRTAPRPDTAVELRTLLEETTPDAVVVERVFYQRNAKTAIPVAQASGVAIALAAATQLPVRQFNAQEVKLAVTGYGAASKIQVQGMVARLCGLGEIPRPADAADALALAITYFMVVRSEQKYPIESRA